MIILGLNAYHGDASAALLVNGDLVGAVEEERLNRQKHCAGFPKLAVASCLSLAPAEISAQDIDHVAISRDPRAQILRKAAYLSGQALHLVLSPAAQSHRANFLATLRQRLSNRQRLHKLHNVLAAALSVSPQHLRAKFHAVEHHRAHLGSAFFASEFSEAAVLSLDGFGDFVSTMWGIGRDRHIDVLGEVCFPHSLGVLYTAVCQWLGFAKYGDEGKVMGLSAYGRPRHLERMRALLQLGDSDTGHFALNLRYFRHHRAGVDMSFLDGTPSLGKLYAPALCELLGAPRPPGPDIEKEEYFCDVAASLQALLEEAVLHICKALYRRTGLRRLCLAGGVALNCVANGRILDESGFRELFIQPAAGDNGTALGAALWVEHQILGRPRRFVMRHAYTGPQFDEAACRAAVKQFRKDFSCDWPLERLSEFERVERAASAIADGAVLGWYQGRMEFGPRALGHRSILCDPRNPQIKEVLNRRIKHREPFRPFAPSVLADQAADWFERGAPSPAMLLVDRVRQERWALVPAVTHQDGTARLQTVSAESSPLYYALLQAFWRRTGVPMLLNTSFNEHEPIVCTPAEALHCFAKTHMDVLVLGPFYIERPGWHPQ